MAAIASSLTTQGRVDSSLAATPVHQRTGGTNVHTVQDSGETANTKPEMNAEGSFSLTPTPLRPSTLPASRALHPTAAAQLVFIDNVLPSPPAGKLDNPPELPQTSSEPAWDTQRSRAYRRSWEQQATSPVAMPTAHVPAAFSDSLTTPFERGRSGSPYPSVERLTTLTEGRTLESPADYGSSPSGAWQRPQRRASSPGERHPSRSSSGDIHKRFSEPDTIVTARQRIHQRMASEGNYAPLSAMLSEMSMVSETAHKSGAVSMDNVNLGANSFTASQHEGLGGISARLNTPLTAASCSDIGGESGDRAVGASVGLMQSAESGSFSQPSTSSDMDLNVFSEEKRGLSNRQAYPGSAYGNRQYPRLSSSSHSQSRLSAGASEEALHGGAVGGSFQSVAGAGRERRRRSYNPRGPGFQLRQALSGHALAPDSVRAARKARSMLDLRRPSAQLLTLLPDQMPRPLRRSTIDEGGSQLSLLDVLKEVRMPSAPSPVAGESEGASNSLAKMSSSTSALAGRDPEKTDPFTQTSSSTQQQKKPTKTDTKEEGKTGTAAESKPKTGFRELSPRASNGPEPHLNRRNYLAYFKAVSVHDCSNRNELVSAMKKNLHSDATKKPRSRVTFEEDEFPVTAGKERKILSESVNSEVQGRVSGVQQRHKERSVSEGDNTPAGKEMLNGLKQLDSAQANDSTKSFENTAVRAKDERGVLPTAVKERRSSEGVWNSRWNSASAGHLAMRPGYTGGMAAKAFSMPTPPCFTTHHDPPPPDVRVATPIKDKPQDRKVLDLVKAVPLGDSQAPAGERTEKQVPNGTVVSSPENDSSRVGRPLALNAKIQFEGRKSHGTAAPSHATGAQNHLELPQAAAPADATPGSRSASSTDTLVPSSESSLSTVTMRSCGAVGGMMVTAHSPAIGRRSSGTQAFVRHFEQKFGFGSNSPTPLFTNQPSTPTNKEESPKKSTLVQRSQSVPVESDDIGARELSVVDAKSGGDVATAMKDIRYVDESDSDRPPSTAVNSSNTSKAVTEPTPSVKKLTGSVDDKELTINVVQNAKAPLDDEKPPKVISNALVSPLSSNMSSKQSSPASRVSATTTSSLDSPSSADEPEPRWKPVQPSRVSSGRLPQDPKNAKPPPADRPRTPGRVEAAKNLLEARKGAHVAAAAKAWDFTRHSVSDNLNHLGTLSSGSDTDAIDRSRGVVGGPIRGRASVGSGGSAFLPNGGIGQIGSPLRPYASAISLTATKNPNSGTDSVSTGPDAALFDDKLTSALPFNTTTNNSGAKPFLNIDNPYVVEASSPEDNFSRPACASPNTTTNLLPNGKPLDSSLNSSLTSGYGSGDFGLATTHRSLYRFLPHHNDELHLEIGDPVYVEEEGEDMWCEGVNIRTGQKGIFPSLYVTELQYIEPTQSEDVKKAFHRQKFDLYFLGSVEVKQHKGSIVLCQAIYKVVTARRMSVTVGKPPCCTLHIDKLGITIIHQAHQTADGKPGKPSTVKRASLKKKLTKFLSSSKNESSKTDGQQHFFPLKAISYCGCHPKDSRYFGFITKAPIENRYACHVFTSLNSTKDVAEAVGVVFNKFYRDYHKYMASSHPTEDIYLE